MSALLVFLAPLGGLLCLVQGQGAPSTAVQVLTPLEAVGLNASSGPARIGQPIEWRIHVDGAALGRDSDERAREHELAALGWVLLDGPEYEGDSTRRYTLMALDPGQRTTLELQLELADGGVASAPAATLEVLGELAEGEDAPRPARGFRAVDDLAVLSPGALGVALGALVLAAGGVFALVRIRRRATPAAPSGPTAAQRLAALTPDLDPSALVGALGPVVRALVDEAAGEDRAALTDEEWCARVAMSTRVAVASGMNVPNPFTLQPELLARAAAIIERSTEVRFSGRAPSVLGARELLDTSRAFERAFERELETANPRELETANPRELETANPRDLETANPREFAGSLANAGAGRRAADPRVEQSSSEGGGT